MDLTPGRQRLVFVVIVIALVGLTSYLIENRHSGAAPAAAPSPSASTPSAAGTQGSSVPPSSLPAATPASTAGGAQIYQWLPFTAVDLSAAANTTTAFAKAYVTWSYTENAAAYGATFSGLANPAEITSLESGYSTAGAQQRTADKQVSTGSGTIDSIRSFGSGPTSITFVVTISQQLTSTQPATTAPPSQYTVTVVSSGSAWLVNDIELSSLGNQ
jgi:hypothetical protein